MKPKQTQVRSPPMRTLRNPSTQGSDEPPHFETYGGKHNEKLSEALLVDSHFS